MIDISVGGQKYKQLFQRALRSGLYGRSKVKTVPGALSILGIFNDTVLHEAVHVVHE
jgi:hypothetical protein